MIRLPLSLAVLSALVLPAAAADLGGSCCADLEERIAELEATAARKGNRKVSLEVYGQINEALMIWDDGVESNAYVVTNDNSRSRIGFRGKAKINADWEAGYKLELGVRTANSKRFTQDNDEGNDNPLDVGLNDLRESNWYLKSKTFGAVTVGRQQTVTNGVTEISLAQTKDFSKYSDVEDTGLGLILRSSVNGGLTASGLSFRRLLGDAGDQPGDGDQRFDLIKYETPEWNGFSLSGSWGEDDFWDVALRYAGEFGGFKIAAGIGYGELTDGPETAIECNAVVDDDQRCTQFGGSISVMHEATGLFTSIAAGTKDDELLNRSDRFAGTGADDGQDFWAMQAGLERKFNDLGKTTIYGEYYDYEGGANTRRTVADGDALDPFAGGQAGAVWSTGMQVYGAGIAQGIDKAAMVLYLSYRHVEADLTVRAINGGVANGAIADVGLEDLDIVSAGGIIKF
jgi:predicted porin